MKKIVVLVMGIWLSLSSCGGSGGKVTIEGKWTNNRTEREDGKNTDPEGKPLQTGLVYEFKKGIAYDYSFGHLNGKKEYRVNKDTIQIGDFKAIIKQLDNDNLVLMDTRLILGFEGKHLCFYFVKD